MIYFIEFLRAIATLLIANSHFKGVYPNDILSFGGGMGLALFYMISGYLLANINENTKFVSWYWKRVMRIYLSLYIVKGILLLLGSIQIMSVEHFIKSFIFPGSWFGASILILYIIYYIFVKYVYNKVGKRAIYLIVTLAVFAFMLLYIYKPSFSTFSLETLMINTEFSIETPYLITQFVWLLCMILGLYLRRYGKNTKSKVARAGYWVVVVLTVILFAFTKLIIRIEGFEHLSWMLAVSYVGFAYGTFNCFMDMEEFLTKVGKNRIGKLIRIISQCSLEIYYIQFFWIELLKNIVFPLNLVLLMVTIIVSAYVVHILSDWIIKRINAIGKAKIQ